MSTKVIDVVAGALVRDGQVLLAQRPPGKHMAGFWEFPGGKAEPGEAFANALIRELHEELAVDIQSFQPLMRLQHAYPDRVVRLNLFKVTAWQQEPSGAEGQAIAWQALSNLQAVDLLPADEPFVRALQLPSNMAITPDDYSIATAVQQAAALSAQGNGLMLRGRWLSRLEGNDLGALLEGCLSAQADIFLNLGFAPQQAVLSVAEMAAKLGIAGLHLPQAYWHSCAEDLNQLKITRQFFLSTACHSVAELKAAAPADFVLASPVLESDKSLPLLGWDGLQQMTSVLPMPIYALGGCDLLHSQAAGLAGAIGVAGIRAFQ